MKPVIAILVCSIALTAPGATTITGGNIANATWTPAGNPYNVQGDVTVTSGGSLTIKPGTVVQFASTDSQGSGADPSRVELIVKGTLTVSGSPTNRVTFKAQSGTAAGTWYGVVVSATATGASLFNVDIQHAVYGLSNAAPGTVLQMSNSTFSVNTAGIVMSAGSPLLNQINVFSNITYGIIVSDTATFSLVNSLLFRNGYGLYVPVAGTVNVLNTVIHANTSYGVYAAAAGTVNSTNCIVTQNAYGFYRSGSPTVNVAYCDVWNNNVLNYFNCAAGPGTISTDPLYVAPGIPTNNFRLQSGSPCIDAGDNSGFPATLGIDLDSLPRFLNDPATADTGHGTAPIIDIGAYEYQPPMPPSVQTLSATSVGAASATLNANALPIGASISGWFEWGTTTNYGNTTPPQALGSDPAGNFSQGVTGLSGGVMYHFRAAGSNILGLAYGTDLNFSTPVFTLAVTNLPGVTSGGVAWGDCNNDGRLDILLTGSNGVVPYTAVWTNLGGNFLPQIELIGGASASSLSSCSWGDFNNDGKLDYVIAGVSHFLFNFDRLLRISYNNGSNFTTVDSNLSDSFWTGNATACGDFDGDGKLDILIGGSSALGAIGHNSNGVFTAYQSLLSEASSVAAGDYNRDGRLDALVGTTLWRNTSTGISNANIGFPMTNSLASPAFFATAWGDYDNDGWLDLVLMGSTNGLASGAVAQVWRNTGSGFTNINAGLPGVFLGSVAWGDYDNDGRLDIVLSGIDVNSNPVTQIWRNTGNGFSNINSALPGVAYSSVAWGDYDNDGRLDVLLAGLNSSNQPMTQVWRNNTLQTNMPPSSPTGLGVSLSSNTVTFSWSAASDAQTPSSGLSYNLRVGTTPGGIDIVSPMSASTGQRRLPQPGNAQMNLSRPITGLPLNQPIYWSVQAIDSSFAGSPFAPEQGFKILPGIVSVTATNFVTGDTNGNGILDESEFAALLATLNGNGIVTESELNLVLSNYFAYSPWLYMTNVAGLGGTDVTFSLTNSLAGAFSVQSTTNLMDWEYLGPAIPRYLFTDTNAPANPQRFYRLRWP